MNVRDLRRILGGVDDNAEVFMEHSYGDVTYHSPPEGAVVEVTGYGSQRAVILLNSDIGYREHGYKTTGDGKRTIQGTETEPLPTREGGVG